MSGNRWKLCTCGAMMIFALSAWRCRDCGRESGNGRAESRMEAYPPDIHTEMDDLLTAADEEEAEEWIER